MAEQHEQQLNSNKKRPRQDTAESTSTDTPDVLEVKRIREDLLVLLDDADTDDTPPTGADDVGPGAHHDLDFVIKSFEEELSGPGVGAPLSGSDSGESHPELGFLLGASDDELGLPSTAHQTPPAQDPAELIRLSSDSSGVDDLWQFDDAGLASFDDPYGFGIADAAGNAAAHDGFLSLDGIFDYSDINFGPSDYTDDTGNNNSNNTWRQETLPAL